MTAIKHTVNGREYEIRSMPTEEGWTVLTFFEDKRVSPRYSITFETAADFQHYQGQRGLDALFDLAKADLDAGIVK